jgi:hypothetical protein
MSFYAVMLRHVRKIGLLDPAFEVMRDRWVGGQVSWEY